MASLSSASDLGGRLPVQRGRCLLDGLDDPVRAGAIARGDMCLANDVRPQDLPEQVQFGVARNRRRRGDPEDRAVALVESDGAVRVDGRIRQVALLVLDYRE